MNLEMNKIAAAVLLSGLIAMVVGKVADGLYDQNEPAEKRGYSIAGAEDTSATASAATEVKPVDILPYLAKAQAAAGEGLVKPCLACHTFQKGEPAKVGPNLYGVVGNHHAHMEGFAYSKAMASLSDKKWDFQTLSEFLEKPAKVVPGTKMAFAGLKKPEDRANVIAYLNSLSDAPLPVPAATAAPAEPAKDEKAAPTDNAKDAKPAEADAKKK
ncbi:MAG: cytochrome c family protein [Rickettsiales bacterium]